MEPPRSQAWRIVNSQIVIETPHLRLRRDDIELPGGERLGNYYVRESRGFSMIFPLTPDERVVLVRQYKHGIGQEVLELPAGGIESGESPADCARRELAEETGYVAEHSDVEHVGSFIFDPTSSTTRYHLYVARNVRPLLEPSFDPTEVIAVELASFEDLRRYVRDGTIDVGVHIASIYYVLDRLGRL